MELSKLIDYDHWANIVVFDELKKISESEVYPEARQLFSHIMGAQVIWISRIKGANTEQEIWPELSISEMEQFLDQNPDKLHSLIQKKTEIIEYSNSKGVTFRNSVEEILMHIVIHGQHHRAQIAKLLRKTGITPPVTDFIFFLRTVDN